MSHHFISYFDESGDDGYPIYSSPLFVLSSIYMPSALWKENHRKIYEFRKFLKTTYGLPIKQEFHTKEFITGKHPYGNKYSLAHRKEILLHFCKMISTLRVRCITVAIDKVNIKRAQYNVLENALTYNIQRIENDINKNFFGSQFMIITDEGRVGKMRKTTRAIQRINFIPSMYNPDSYRKEIKNLIEDPLPKNSAESYFIQVVDLISFVVSLYVKENLCSPKILWSKRVGNVLAIGDEVILMEALKKCFNLKASSTPYGIVYYPKK